MKNFRIYESVCSFLSALLIGQISAADTVATTIYGNGGSRALCRTPVNPQQRYEPQHKIGNGSEEYFFSKQESEFARVTTLKLRKYLL